MRVKKKHSSLSCDWYEPGNNLVDFSHWWVSSIFHVLHVADTDFQLKKENATFVGNVGRATIPLVLEGVELALWLGRRKAGTFLLQAFSRCVANLKETPSFSLLSYEVLSSRAKHQSYPAMAICRSPEGSSAGQAVPAGASSYDFRAGYVAHTEILQA
jgi:hypothetical protein